MRLKGAPLVESTPDLGPSLCLDRAQLTMALIDSIERLNLKWPRYKPQSIKIPLNSQAVAELATVLAVDLPAELIALLKKYNGLNLPEEFFWKLQTSDEIVKTTKFMKRQLQKYAHEFDCSQEVTATAWSPKWIPFAKDCTGNVYICDAGPSSLGVYGQVLYWDHEGSVRHQANSIVEWLELEVRNMEQEMDGYEL